MIWIQEFLEFLIKNRYSFEYTSDFLTITLCHETSWNTLFICVELWAEQEILSTIMTDDSWLEVISLWRWEATYEFLIKFMTLHICNLDKRTSLETEEVSN